MRKIKKISVRIAFWYILLVMIVFGGVFALIAYNYSNYILNEKKKVSGQKLDIITLELDSVVDRFRNIQSQLISDNIVNQIISNKGKDELLSDVDRSIINNCLENVRTNERGIDAVYILDQDGKILGNATDSITASQGQDFPGLTEFIDSKSYSSFPSAENDENSSTVTYYGAYYLPPQYQYGAYVAIRMSKNRMFYDFKNLADSAFDNVIVYNEKDNRSIYASNTILPLPESFDQAAASRMDLAGVNYMVFENKESHYPDWRILALQNQKDFVSEIRRLTLYLIAFFAATIIFIAFASFKMAKSITRPLLSVNEAMKQLETGEFPAPLPSYTEDETHQLISGFNHMIDSIRQLTDNIRLEQKEKRKIEVAMVKSQLELLQSQINPHFIHNTLNTMNYMALSAGNQELSETIVSFNSLLRASISSKTEYTTVLEEVSYIKDYMNIQQKRYSSNGIFLENTISPEVELALVPRLIMQPLVENALFHGLLPLAGRGGYIKILCMQEEDMLHVYVVDNGIGIPQEKLELIEQGNLPNPKGYNHIGINNVKERLLLLYQNRCHFYITSAENSGTTIYFSIPCVLT